MINVSKEFIETMEERTDFTENAEITFSDGTVLPLSSSEFTINNNSVTDGAGENSFPLGVAIARCIQIEIMNDADQYSNYDFLGAKIRLFLEFELSETVERVEFGTFTVITPETYGTTVIISAVDDMYKADKEYTTGLLFPSTLGEVVRDSCTTTGITLGTTSFFNDDFIIAEKPAGLTHRELYGYAAMISCGNARINRLGSLEIKSYDFADSFVHLDGGDFINYDLPDRYDGGTFEDYSADNQVDGGAFLDREKMHILSKWKNLFVDTDDLVITGVQTVYREDNEEIKILEGYEGYVLQIDNPFIAGKEEEILKLIAPRLIGGTFRKFEGDLFSNPLIEFMDNVYIIDRKGNCYQSIVTDANFVFYGYTTVKCSVESALRSSSRYYSTAAKAYQESVKLTEKEKTEREKAIEILNKTLSEASGLYETEVSQADGSKIYYLHDKKTLAESKNVIKLTSNAVGLSTDGGNTFPAGFTIDGVMIAKILQTEGINADWINAGALTIKDSSGKVIFSANTTTKRVDFINGYFDASGAHFSDGEFSGTVKSSVITGSRIETEATSGQQKVIIEGGKLSFQVANVGGFSPRISGYIYPYTTTAPVGNYEYDFDAVALQSGDRAVLELYANTDKVMQAIPKYGDVEARAYFPLYVNVGKTLEVSQEIIGYSDLIVDGDFMCYGAKDRIVKTEHYGARALHCYETPSPMFGDIGTAVINQDGFCVVSIDDVFSETINDKIEYHVFLQKEGQGDLWIDSKEYTHFVVKGTPGLSFSWELKAVQNGYEVYRLDDINLRHDAPEAETELFEIGIQELNEYDKETEEFL